MLKLLTAKQRQESEVTFFENQNHYCGEIKRKIPCAGD
ncbi:hypothetical protein ABH902_002484 [Enterococcus sp. UD-01]|jgi:hypothetical protein